MRRVQYVPGVIGAGAAHTLPSGAPPIRTVILAQIWHLPVGIGVPGDHTQAEIIAAIDDHPVHAHDLAVGAAGVVTAQGASAGGDDLCQGGAATIPGGAAPATGVRNNAAPQAHVATAVPVVHAGGVAADPILAATPTRTGDYTFTLNQNCIAGDVLVLVYNEIGEVVRAS